MVKVFRIRIWLDLVEFVFLYIMNYSLSILDIEKMFNIIFK